MTAHSYILQKCLHIAYEGHNYTYKLHIATFATYIAELHVQICTQLGSHNVDSHIPILLDLDKDMCAMHTVHVSAVMTCF